MFDRVFGPIDKVIDSINMYRVLLYYLIYLLAAAFVLSATGHLGSVSPINIVISSSVLVIACWIINRSFAYIFDAPHNPESSILTALILTLIITPNPTGFNFLFLLAASGLAMASKYILNIRYKHIFNPAAIAVVLTAWGPRQSASWWVGTAAMLPFVIVGGIVVMRKVRREHMVIAFLIATAAATALLAFTSKASIGTSLQNMALSSSAFFLGFVMLTEPYTSPTTRMKQIIYAVIVGVIMSPQFHIFRYYSSPEIALVVGNIFAYIVGSKVKLFPLLVNRRKIAAGTLEFAFDPERSISYKPGQYMEWTLNHSQTDSRGSRRYFTLASSPTEDKLLLGVKFYDNGSSYKSAMMNMNHDTLIVASQLSGDFVMPSDTKQKLAFIAGGIGITPFRSMTKYLVDKKEKRDVRIIYGARTEADFAYKEIFEQARSGLGIGTTYMVSDKIAPTSPNTIQGMVNAEVIKREIPDFKERVFYISGTHQMVESVKFQLQDMGVSARNIRIDFFPGYA